MSAVMEATADNVDPVQFLEGTGSAIKIEDLTVLDSESDKKTVDEFERIVKDKDDEPKVDSIVVNSCGKIWNPDERWNSPTRIPIEVYSCGASMRKEKEWKRTLACKLLEDRHNADGGEGMDLLWEAYEIDSNKHKEKDIDYTKMTMNNNKKMKNKSFSYEGDDDINVGKLCCLQTLKLSAGKMSLGMEGLTL